MSEHVTIDDLHRLKSGDLAEDQVLAAARHLASCPDCTRLSESAYSAKAISSIDAAIHDSGEHIDSERELFAFVDRTLDSAARARIVSHIDHCQACREDVTDATDMSAVGATHWRRRLWSIAALVALALIGLAAFNRWDEPATQRPVSNSTPTAQPAPVVTTQQLPPPTRYNRADWSALTESALATGSLSMPASLRILRPPSVTVRSANNPPAILSPAGTVVEEQQPELSWPASPGATYVVTMASGADVVMTSGRLSAAHWRVAKPLARGGTFRWEVEVQSPNRDLTILPSPPQPVSLFRVLDEAGLAELNKARQEFPNDHLLLGALSARHGLVGAATRELDVYAAQNPDKPQAKRLASSVRHW